MYNNIYSNQCALRARRRTRQDPDLRGQELKWEEGLEFDGSGLGNDGTEQGCFCVYSYYSYIVKKAVGFQNT